MRYRCHARLLLGSSLVLLPSLALPADCTGLTGLPAARCAVGNIRSEGLLDEQALPPRQSDVPQYGGTPDCRDASCAGSSATQYHRDPTTMNADALNRAANDPLYGGVVEMGSDADAYDLTDSAPVVTAEQTAAGFAEPDATEETCTEYSVCTDPDAAERRVTCRSPGAATAFCQVIADSTTLSETGSGRVNRTFGWCADHYVYLRVHRASAFKFTIQYLDTGPEGIWHKWCPHSGGWDHLTTVTVSSRELKPGETILRESFSIGYAATHHGGCSYNSRSGTIGHGQSRIVLVTCPGGGPQTGTIRLTSWNYSALIRRDVIVDNCAPYRTIGELVDSQCSESGPRPVPDGKGKFVQRSPPAAPPASGCWVRAEEWIHVAPGRDECTAYKADPACGQVAATCVTEIVPGRCERYEKEYVCRDGQACGEWTVVKECNSCGTEGSLVPYCTDLSYAPNDNLLLAGSYLALLEEMEHEWDPENLRIFPGERLACDYSSIAPPVIDCCDSDPSKLFGRCSDEEERLAEAKQAQTVHFVGNRCVDKVLFVCLRAEDVYCSFGSKLSRIVHEQGRDGAGRPWGSPGTPDCDGLTVEEFQRLDFGAMDFSEYYADVNAHVNVAETMTRLEQKICTSLGTC